MNITNRTFTYPVLTAENDNYKESSFSSKFVSCDKVDANNLKLIIDLSLNNDNLKRLIRAGCCEYVIQLECSLSSYRIIQRTSDEHVEMNIPIKKVTDYVEVLVLLMSKTDINDFYSIDFNDAFEGKHFVIPKNSILAYENNDKLRIQKNYEKFEKLDSIFKVQKLVLINPSEKDQQKAEYDLSNDYIIIRLGENQFNAYQNMYQNPAFQPIINSFLIYPALIHTLDMLAYDEDCFEACKDCKWFLSLEKAYSSYVNGESFSEKLLNYGSNMYILAQEIMDLPLNKAFEFLLFSGESK